MYGFDQFLIAGTIATLFWMLATIYLQKKWHIYTLFMGKKYAFVTHIVVMSVVALQLLALTFADIVSRWTFTLALWPLGDIIFALSLTLLVMALRESGPGVLVGAQAFGRKQPRSGKLWRQFKQPLALGFGGIYLGLALLTGHIVYFIVAGILAAGLWGVSIASKKLLS